MNSRHMLVRIATLFVLFCLSSPTLHARLGEGVELERLIEKSDLICCGKMTRLEVVPSAEPPQEGTGTVWVTMTFVIDHQIKGSSPTNIISLLVAKTGRSEGLTEAIKKAETEVDKRRVLVFLRDVVQRPDTFALVDPADAMMLVAPSKPEDIREDMGTERRIEIEMIQAIKSLEPDKSAQVRAMAKRWRAKTAALQRVMNDTEEPDP
jgi:hypothetical protein